VFDATARPPAREPGCTGVISVNMQMSARSRILDLLPILVVFAVVTAFATYLVVEQVVREPLTVPAPRTTPADELPHSTGATLRETRR